MTTGKSSEYFPHDCNAKDDPKIMLLLAQLGLEAYGIYWVLIEYLRQQTNYTAPIILLDPLSRRYGSSKEKFEAVVKNFNLFKYDDACFSSASLIRRMAPLEDKRLYMKELADKRWKNENNTSAMRTHSEGNAQAMQSKVKESRVKKSKVKKSKEEKSIKYTPTNLDTQNQLLFQKWNEWCDFRKLLKKPYKTTTGTAAAYNKLCSLANNNSETAIAIINQSMENEWLGFFPLKTTRGMAVIPGEDPVDKIIREAHESMKNKQTPNNDGI